MKSPLSWYQPQPVQEEVRLYRSRQPSSRSQASYLYIFYHRLQKLLCDMLVRSSGSQKASLSSISLDCQGSWPINTIWEENPFLETVNHRQFRSKQHFYDARFHGRDEPCARRDGESKTQRLSEKDFKTCSSQMKLCIQCR